LLVPLEKTRSNDEAPAFEVDISYIDHTAAWTEKGRAKVSLLAIDMPISRSSILLHYSPQFHLIPVPGSFRVSEYRQPLAGLARPASAGPADNDRPAQAAAASQSDIGGLGESTKQAVQRLNQSARSSRPGRNLPVSVAFPHFGPSVFLVSELTSENQAPSVEFDFQREKKRGER
jgi:hypothetical protein